MPDLLASTILLPLKPAIPPRAAPVAVPGTADFTAVLGELVLPPGAKPQGGKGQALAGDGKILPVEGEDDETDPVIAWLPAGLVPLQPIDPEPLPDTVLIEASPVAFEASAATVPAGEATISVTLPEAVQLTAEPIVIAADVEPAPVEVPSIALEIEPEAKAEMSIRERLTRPVLAPAVTPQPVVPGAPATQTAAQVFAAAISASFDSPAVPMSRTDAAIIQNQTVATEQLRTTVQAMSGAEQPPLDLSRDDWAGKMIDRIATLRDAAEAADTRIRLAPENLGNVDVSIRRDGDRIHVHFAAENAATRQLLADAAPRLAELADARGVKLGQTSVDAGAGGQQGAPDQQQPTQSVRPVPVTAHASETDHDDRIA